MKDTQTVKPSVLVVASPEVEAYMVRELRVRGFSIKILSKSLEKVKRITNDHSEVVIGVTTLPKTLEGKLNNINIVISTITIAPKEKGLFDSVIDYYCNMNLLKEAQRAGVTKFVYAVPRSVDLAKNTVLQESHNNFINQLKTSGIDYTILRTNGTISDSGINSQVCKAPKNSFFRLRSKHTNPIHPRALAYACADAVKIAFAETFLR